MSPGWKSAFFEATTSPEVPPPITWSSGCGSA